MILLTALTGCGATIPTDPEGTLDRMRGGDLRVGVSVDPGLASEVGGVPEGPLVDLVDDFAGSIDADTEWTIAGEETLVGLLESGDLDLAVGGFSESTPWIERAGISRGYTRIDGSAGRSIVMLVPLGENAFLSELEIFLDEEVGG